ncbi:MAG: phospho-N-acetylmuramoyl-pentapeptide-transferase [Planctomycetota bacterium]
MLYYLHLLSSHWSALDVFRSVCFRAAFALVSSFLICVAFGPRAIAWLKRKKINENTAKKDSEFLAKLHNSKKDTPTMGGTILMASALFGIVMWCRFDVLFVTLCIFTMIALMLVGLYDDYIKLTENKRDGLSKKEKIFYQMLIGGGVGAALYLYGDDKIATKLVIPFIDPSHAIALGMLYPLWAMFVTSGTSNAVNLTDGLDGLATLCFISSVVAFGLIAYFAGHATIAAHLNMPRVPGAQELAIVCASLAGACMGFLWFNSHPAEVFMGDTGSLPLGGLLGLIALCVKQELLLVVIGGVFVVEALSVIIQVFSFKVFKKRVFLISPLHHHFEKVGWSEPKIVARFFIVSVLLAVFTVAALRIR